MANILSIGKSGLQAAQLGVATTGHNITNASTPGYSRQVMVQGAQIANGISAGFVGSGTEVLAIRRVFNDFLATQVTNAQSSENALGNYLTQVNQINNMLADPTTGLSPALQDFFNGVQNLASNPGSNATRQSMLSSADTLANQFQSMSSQLSDMSANVNAQIRDSVTTINSYASQLATLNNAIARAQGGNDAKPANDLLDQRDQLVSDLSKEIKVSVVKQGDDYNIFIGNGQPLVVGGTPYSLAATQSPTDISRTTISYQGNGTTFPLAENSLQGGKLGGLLEFRSSTLDTAQNAIGRIAIGLATTFNAQHVLGQDQNGAMGGQFFSVGTPVVSPATTNGGTMQMSASISNVNALTTSNYQVKYIGPGNYQVMRVSDGAITTTATMPVTIDGVDFSIVSGAANPGDTFLVKPTAGGAAGMNVLVQDTAKIAAAAPVRTNATATNAGSGKISAGSVSAGYAPASMSPAATMTYNAGANQLTGFPLVPVTVTNGGVSTTYAAGAPVPYTDGATISFSNVSFTIGGAPANGDTFTIGQNTNGLGDNRNALLLAGLQTATTLGNGTMNFQSAFGQFVNTVGNKAHELSVTKSAAEKLTSDAIEAQQADSGVNLDEEAANLMRYQQAYQAAGKVMQTASTLFDTLLSIGNH
ncbi:MAG: flagellar hook-associated protein FlgK [Proteobacteria bacterium]|nr:flagellar hook-associated protein FlgK [Pseudomonadota bacterium]